MEQNDDMNEPILTNRMILSDLHKKVGELHSEVFGHELSGRPSYGKRIHKLETAEKNRTKLYVILTAISSTVTIGFRELYHYIIKS